MIKNINYKGQFNLEVITKLNDKLDKIKKDIDICNGNEYYKLDNDRQVVIDILLLGLIISNDLYKIDEKFKINIAIRMIERILHSPLYNIEDSEFNKDYMVNLYRKLKERCVWKWTLK